MLQFLRKYQKFFFAIVAVVIIASFSLFGTYGTIQTETEVPDHRIGTLIDGSHLMQKEVDLLSRFMATSSDERQLLEKGQMPNMLNDGVIQREFLQTGLLPLIARPYFSEIATEIQERVDKAKNYRHYSHPQAPFISSEAVWNRFFPSMKQEIEQLSRTSQATEDSLRLLGTLYLEQQQLPPDVLRRILAYQQEQFEWIAHDPRLEHADLSLFGFQSLEDWFGPKLMNILAQVVLNGAAEARTQGYRVSEDEARRSLQQIFSTAIKKAADDREFGEQELQAIYQQQIRLLHATERQTILLWQKVLTFRRMVEAVGAAVAVDAEAYRSFADFAREKIHVHSYELPEALHIKDFRALLKLQTYLDAVNVATSKKVSTSLYLPHTFASTDDINRRTPELAEYRFVAEIAEVTYDTLAAKVPFKQVYEWEIEEANWQTLGQEFSVLSQSSCSTVEERYAALEKIEPGLRNRIDRSAREAIVREHPEWIEGAFAQAERKKVAFGLRQKGGTLPFIGVNDRDALYKALLQAPIKSTGEASLPAPYRLSTDDYHHYEVVLLAPPSELTLLTFAEASADGTLDGLLDKKLEEVYPDIRKKYSGVFQVSSGGWKPLADVKDYVGAYLYIDLLKSIEIAAKKTGVTWPKLEGGTYTPRALELYAQHRLQLYTQEALGAISREDGEEGWIVHPNSNRISEQWRLVKHEKDLTRAQVQALRLTTLFEQPIPAWSSVVCVKPGEWTFVHALEKKHDSKSDIEEMVKAGQMYLANEAKRTFLKTLLDDIQTKKVIVVTESGKERERVL